MSGQANSRKVEIANQVSVEEGRRLAGKSHLVASLLGQLRQAGLPEPMTEVRFQVLRKWRLDLAYPMARPAIAIEVDGATYTSGRHTRGKGYAEDCRKLNEATLHGWAVYRFTADHIRSGEAVQMIERALRRV